mgnify:CR=1 FL=1
MFSNDCSLGLALTNEHHGCVTPCQYLIASKLTAECGDHNNQKICELAKIPGLVFSGYWPPLTEPTFAHSAALVTQGSQPPRGGAAKNAVSKASECQLPMLRHDWNAAAENVGNPPKETTLSAGLELAAGSLLNGLGGLAPVSPDT